MDITSALERFSLQLEADGRSEHTVQQYRRHVRGFGRWAAGAALGGDVGRIGDDDVARYLASDAARTRADGAPKRAASVNALRGSLKGFFGYLHRAGLVESDPSRLVRRARCGPPPPRALSREEQDRLLAALAAAEGETAERDHTLVHLLLATGLRIGSAIGLEVGDVDLGRGELEVRRTKGDQPRRVILGTAIREHLGRYLAGGKRGPLFTGRGGRRMSSRHAHRRLSFWLERAGIARSASPHSLRHTFAMDLYRRTGDVLLVKEALGHRSVASTLVYARADEDRLREALGG